MSTVVQSLASNTFDSRMNDDLFTSESSPFSLVAIVLLVILGVFIVLSLCYAFYLKKKNDE